MKVLRLVVWVIACILCAPAIPLALVAIAVTRLEEGRRRRRYYWRVGRARLAGVGGVLRGVARRTA